MDATTETLALGAATGAIAALLVLLRLHGLAAARGRGALTAESISAYATGPHHRYWRSMVVLLGAAGALLCAALARADQADPRALAFLGTFAAARLLIAGVPRGRAHLVLGAVAFTAIAFGAADVTSDVERLAGWAGTAGDALRVASDAVGVGAVLALAAHVVPQAPERAVAIAERLLYLATIAWLLVASAHLATLAAGG